jgi:hypothetical protein
MNDDQLLTVMRGSLTGVKDSLVDVHLDRPVAAITGRARARRLRRGVCGVAAAVALGAGLSLALIAGPESAPSLHVTMDAWSVSKTPAGQVELTLRELKNQALLEKALADAGVPAIVRFGEFCEAADQPDNLTGSVRDPFGPPQGWRGILLAITINPAAIAPGTEVDMGVQDIGNRHGVIEDEIVKAGASLSCHPVGHNG